MRGRTALSNARTARASTAFATACSRKSSFQTLCTKKVFQMGWLMSNKDFESTDERKLEELFKEAVRYGAVLSLFHFDAHAKEPNAVKDSLVDFVSRMTKEEGVLYCKAEI